MTKPGTAITIGTASSDRPQAVHDPEKLAPISGALDAALRTWSEGNDISRLPMAVIREASDHLKVLADVLAPSSEVHVMRWLLDLSEAGLLRTPESGKAVQAALRAICETCAPLPAGVWAVETRLAFQARQTHWPAPAQVFQFLEPYAERLKRQRMVCKAIGKAWKARKAAEAATDRSTPTPDAVAHVDRVISQVEGSLRPPSVYGKTYGRLPDTSTPIQSGPSRAERLAMLAQYDDQARNAPHPELRKFAEARANALRASLEAPSAGQSQG